MFQPRSFLVAAVLTPILYSVPCPAVDSYGLIGELLPKEQMPRVLNSDDIQINPNDPEPLFSPTGDFNNDGIEDMAISGIYTLPTGPKKYFLLVGSELKNPVRQQKLFFQEYKNPVFIHKPGTTGEKDPGDQAFSVTFCSECTDGQDLYWNKSKNSFIFQSWTKRVRHYKEISAKPVLEEVAPEVVDQALKIVGELKDVKIFVAGVKKKGGTLGTRVTRRNNDDPATVAQVSVFEKSKKENLYDSITVDVATGAVLDRKRKVKLGK